MGSTRRPCVSTGRHHRARPVRWPGAAFATLLIASMAGLEARAERPRVYAIEGATIIVAPGRVIENGTLVMRDGLIESVGSDLTVPPDAVVVDAAGQTLHAGFIDACTSAGVARESDAQGGGERSNVAAPGAAHPISRIRPERRVLDRLDLADRQIANERRMGFTTGLCVPDRGIFRGTSALVSFGEEPAADNVVVADAAQHVAFESGAFGEAYPTSLMGAIASIRQGLEDARRHHVWQERYAADPRGMKRPDTLSAYEPLSRAASGAMPVVFEGSSPSNVLRAIGLGKEYGLRTMVTAPSSVYEVLDQLRASGVPLILPLAFPDKPDMKDADEAAGVGTLELERYLGARTNAGRLAGGGVTFALGTCGMVNPSDFPANLREAIGAGLSAEDALAALTTVPARLFGVERSMGTLEVGRTASLVLESGPLFAEETKPVRVWVDGREFPIEEKRRHGDPNAKVDPRGVWSVVWNVQGQKLTRVWEIRGEPGSLEGTAETSAGTVSFHAVKLRGNELTLLFPAGESGGVLEIVVIVEGEKFEGEGELPGGETYSVDGTRTAGPETKEGAR